MRLMARRMLLMVSVWSCSLFAYGAATKPAVPSTPDIARLIRQLDSPRPAERAKADEQLGLLGAESLPVLREASQTASFEARVRLQKIIQRIEASDQGVLVARIVGLASSGVERMGIKPGDRIVQVGDTPVRSWIEYIKAVRAMEDQEYQVGVVNEQGKRFVRYDGYAFLLLADYAPAYGKPLIAAVRAADTGRYAEACAHFDEAFKAGLILQGNAPLPMLYAICLDYTGQFDKAKTVLVDYARRYKPEVEGDRGSGWSVLREFYAAAFEKDEYRGRLSNPLCDEETDKGSARTVDGHIARYIRQQCVKQSGEREVAGPEYTEWMSRALHRCPEAIAGMTAALAGSAAQEGWLNFELAEELLRTFDILKMKKEGLELIRFLAGLGPGRGNDYVLARHALQFGDRELALTVQRQAFDATMKDAPDDPRRAGFQALMVVQLLLAAGRPQEAVAFIESHPAMNADLVFSDASMGWRDLASLRVKQARAVLATIPQQPPANGDEAGARSQNEALAVFKVLARQVDPDLDELKRVLDLALRLCGDSPGETDYCRSQIADAKFVSAMIRGELDYMNGVLRARKRTLSGFPLQNAGKLLCQHWGTLTGSREQWRKIEFAYPAPAGEWLLVTRDLRLGWAGRDLVTVDEIPLPSPEWTSRGGSSGAFVISPSGRSVLELVDDENVRLLSADKKKWTPFCRFVGFRASQYLWRVKPALDEFVAALMARSEEDRVVVWPPDDLAYNFPYEQPVAFMLADGTWFFFDAKDKRLLAPRETVEKVLGRRVEIYGTSRLLRGKPAYLFTDQGVVRWDPASGEVRQIPFPDREQPAPVVGLNWAGELRDGCVHVGVFAASGGAVYSLHLESGKLVREQSINESYPITFWQQKTAEQNREQVMAALKDAGLGWPPVWMKRSNKATD